MGALRRRLFLQTEKNTQRFRDYVRDAGFKISQSAGTIMILMHLIRGEHMNIKSNLSVRSWNIICCRTRGTVTLSEDIHKSRSIA